MKTAPSAEGAVVSVDAQSKDGLHFIRSRALDQAARAIVLSHGGDWHGTYGMVPGPGHGPKDRSCKVWQHGDRILVHSFCGDDWRDCRAHLGLDGDWRAEPHKGKAPRRQTEPVIARPSWRVRELLRTATAPDLVPDAVAYLSFRHLWPLPPDCTLKAHAGASYWNSGDPPELVGRFPALLAPVVDIDDALVTLHVTYLSDGRKLADRTARKLLGPTGGRIGCAARLFPSGPVLGVAEGLETAIAASRVLRVPVWPCLSTGLLSRFQAPPGVERLVIAADNDVPGLKAAWQLRDHLDLPCELRVSTRSDFAEDLEP